MSLVSSGTMLQRPFLRSSAQIMRRLRSIHHQLLPPTAAKRSSRQAPSCSSQQGQVRHVTIRRTMATLATERVDAAKVQAFEASITRFDPSKYRQMNVQLFKSPGMYAQKAGLLDDAGSLLQAKGKQCGIVTGDFINDKYGSRLDTSLANAGIKATKILMGPEACWDEVYRVVQSLQDHQPKYIIGFGAGKIMDTARVSAHILGIPHVLIPTLASTDAAGTALGVLYNADGTFKEYFHLPDSPSAVLMDTSILAESPIRFTISGLGDAMSTYYEARAVRASGGSNLVGGLPGQASWALATACHQTLLEEASRALRDISTYQKAVKEEKEGVVTPAIEKVMEANSLLSGVGAATCGIACAHALHNGLTSLPEVHDYRLHGEIVGWTTVVQLFLEKDNEEAIKIARWNKAVGLPLTFEDMNMTEKSFARLQEAVELACSPTDTLYPSLQLERMTPIHEAVNQGNLPEVKRSIQANPSLLEARLEARTNIKGSSDVIFDDSTLLIVASWSEHKEMVEWLLDRGADTEAMDEHYQTALFWASDRGHVAIVRSLF